MHGQLSSTVINTVKMNYIKKDSMLTGLCTLGWALGTYSLIIFVVVKREDLLDASLAILKKMKKICYTDVCDYLQLYWYIFIYEM